MSNKNLKSDLLKKEILLGTGSHLTVDDCHLIAKGNIEILLAPQSRDKMGKSYNFLQKMLEKRETVYGLNTQFGDQVCYVDPHEKVSDEAYFKNIQNRQYNLVQSHCSGLGNIVSKDIIRVAMALRAQCLSQGYSGVNPKVVDSLLGFINSGIVPTVRQYGSIGASGDLIPLASIATALIGGDTDVFYQGKTLPAATAISKANLSKLSLSMRDGLALINGTSFMTAIASLGVFDLKRLFVQMLSTVAMALESLMVINCAYNPVVHQLKNQSGEIEVNEFLNHFWQGSQLLTDIDQLILLNKNDHNYRIQDYYSIRAVAQGFGPFIENLKMAELWVENEINSVNDNPIIDASKKKILHNANFMGYYITDACDLLKMDIAQASTWLHALLANMVHPRKNNLLPTNLVSNPEIHNGFRPLQLLVASIAVQNRKLGQSHQSYMLPTEGDNQDVNSLGTIAAFDLRESVGNIEKIISILLVASVQALEFRGIEKSSYKSQLVCKNIRKLFPAISAGRPLTNELETVISALREGNIILFLNKKNFYFRSYLLSGLPIDG